MGERAGANDTQVMSGVARPIAPPRNKPAEAFPSLVRRFVERNASLREGATRVRFEQSGEMQLKPGRWLPFRATQEMALERVEFAWDARFRLAPLISMRVQDWYRDDDSGLDARLFGRIPVVRAGGIEVARAEAMRYLAELAWAPHAMVTNSALEWREIDAKTIEVATPVGDARVKVLLHFDSNGDITAASASARPRLVGKTSVPTPFRGTYGDYRVVGGVRLPSRAKVAWLPPEGPFTYFRGRLTSLAID